MTPRPTLVALETRHGRLYGNFVTRLYGGNRFSDFQNSSGAFMTHRKRVLNYLAADFTSGIIMYIRSTNSNSRHFYEDIGVVDNFWIGHFPHFHLSYPRKNHCFHILPSLIIVQK